MQSHRLSDKISIRLNFPLYVRFTIQTKLFVQYTQPPTHYYYLFYGKERTDLHRYLRMLWY